MKLPIGHIASLFAALALLSAPRTAFPEGPWDAVDKTLGQAGKVQPGKVHRYGWPRRDLVSSPAEKSAFDKVQEVLGRTGSMAGRVLQVGVPRAAKIEENGVEVPPSQGMATAMNFQVVGSRVATTGDFVLIADEVNPVIRELEAHGIRVTALHCHMLRESPRLFFMHFRGVDDPSKIAEGLKAALGKVAVR